MADTAASYLSVWDGERAVPVQPASWALVVAAYAGEAWELDQLDQMDGTSMFVFGEVVAAGRVRWTDLVAAQTRPDLTDPAAARRYADTAWRHGLLAWEVTADGDYVSAWAAFAHHHGLDPSPGGGAARDALSDLLARG
ncbi:MAG: hypothetical protein RLZZ383_1909 [Pseudomonadota bacterium]|jgi:hypothetical protein